MPVMVQSPREQGKPRLLDLFCCAGGAGTGYSRAGFDVTGIDITPQPNYPFAFHQADALEYLADHGHEYDAIHASPPCQHYARVTRWRGSADNHPDLLGPTLDLLASFAVPWIVENVPDASLLRADYLLCGSMFGLKVRRHRMFQTSWHGFGFMPSCDHRGLLPFEHKGERAYADAMGCEWMTSHEAREAIPPAYTEFLGVELMSHLTELAA